MKTEVVHTVEKSLIQTKLMELDNQLKS